jgi:hypothetical protein
MSYADDVLVDSNQKPPSMLSSVPDNEITESMCRILFYPHIDDDTWEDYMDELDCGGTITSAKYGITVYRDMQGNLHFPLI